MSHAVTFCWRNGATTVEVLPEGQKSFLFRFHVDASQIPGDVLSACVVAEVDEYECEIKAWGGRRGPTTADRKAIAEFCRMRGYVEVYWWRYKNGCAPKKVWLYQVFPV
ncbi:hypothetical protein SAMN05216420_101418 [Nitrosospira sp. Nl5]|uniref:hypothetical protein n=1 Tax=Nitrosospira sp. Nl5 TaxID=200120 RepID=UPI00088DACCE|nr:hypothetical protein [Nitrosospira sp. Nl5]SCX94803.1 hypothetical protein SAMN05216420_101418 [Nitrosospira sp. Nl5]